MAAMDICFFPSSFFLPFAAPLAGAGASRSSRNMLTSSFIAAHFPLDVLQAFGTMNSPRYIGSSTVGAPFGSEVARRTRLEGRSEDCDGGGCFEEDATGFSVDSALSASGWFFPTSPSTSSMSKSSGVWRLLRDSGALLGPATGCSSSSSSPPSRNKGSECDDSGEDGGLGASTSMISSSSSSDSAKNCPLGSGGIISSSLADMVAVVKMSNVRRARRVLVELTRRV